MIFEGEIIIKDTKMSSFSSDFQTLIKLKFPLYFVYELSMSLRRKNKDNDFTNLSRWSISVM